MTEIKNEHLLQFARAVARTANDEINCETFLEHAAAYLERNRARASKSPELAAVEQHLAVCPECYEEYQLLKLAVEM